MKDGERAGEDAITGAGTAEIGEVTESRLKEKATATKFRNLTATTCTLRDRTGERRCTILRT